MEVYFSVDIETDGFMVGYKPGDNSILSIGSVAFDSDGNMLDTFFIILDKFPGQISDPDTVK